MKVKGQAMIDYMVLIIITVAALVATQIYVKRGIQGRFKAESEQLIEGQSLGYSPGATKALAVTTTRITEEAHSETIDNPEPEDDIVRTTTLSNVTQTTSRREDILSLSEEAGGGKNAD